MNKAPEHRRYFTKSL